MDDQHKRGLLRLFVLRTLSTEPKSGYDILKEITEKTQGEWHPSKGTIYPILTELDKEGLIETVEEGARARRAFRTTDEGMSHLTDAIERHRPSHRGRMDGRRLLFVETFFDETEREILRLSHSIRRKALSTNRKRKAIKLLKQTLRSIADLEESK
jgi:DNA-binding PadR family transcriptional regulator